MKRKVRSRPELYETMRLAIEYVHKHVQERPSVAVMARAVGMNPSRFEHAFSEWVGISPKRFLSYTTKERAKRLLGECNDVLLASYTSGLSGPGRLHDLLVAYDAVSPGEYKKGIITITYGIHSSPFGWCLIGLTKRGIARLSFMDTFDRTEAARRILEVWPKAHLIYSAKKTEPYIKKIFAVKKPRSPLRVLVKGTNFQIKVWEALLTIPHGNTATYAHIAKAIGSPRAVRAVGTACGKNPIAFLIPCHRVLTSMGGLGGYRWGGKRKEVMLLWESISARKY